MCSITNNNIHGMSSVNKSNVDYVAIIGFAYLSLFEIEPRKVCCACAEVAGANVNTMGIPATFSVV